MAAPDERRGGWAHGSRFAGGALPDSAAPVHPRRAVPGHDGAGRWCVTEDVVRFEVPLSTVAEAVRALAVPVSTFHTWARGYERLRPDGRRHGCGPVVSSKGTARPGPTTAPGCTLAGPPANCVHSWTVCSNRNGIVCGTYTTTDELACGTANCPTDVTSSEVFC